MTGKKTGIGYRTIVVAAPAALTLIVPVIPSCSVQTYEYVPGVSKRWRKAQPLEHTLRIIEGVFEGAIVREPTMHFSSQGT